MLSSGLVEQVTTLSVGHLGMKVALKDLNQQRRIRRMRRVVIAAAEAARDTMQASGQSFDTLLLTLTYRWDGQWAPEQIGFFMQQLLQRCRRQGVDVKYQWVLELTKRGRPHYHVLLWVPKGFRIPKQDAHGYWPHGMTNVVKARSAVGYLVKYATKGTTEMHQLPKGARLFGVGGCSAPERLRAHRAGLPMWLTTVAEVPSGARRCARVGWVCKATGAVFRSPFKVTWGRDSFGIVQVTIIKVEVSESEDQNQVGAGDRQEYPPQGGRQGVPFPRATGPRCGRGRGSHCGRVSGSGSVRLPSRGVRVARCVVLRGQKFAVAGRSVGAAPGGCAGGDWRAALMERAMRVRGRQ